MSSPTSRNTRFGALVTPLHSVFLTLLIITITAAARRRTSSFYFT